MSQPRPIEIIGGGLAGLSLGVALARAGIPTTVIEAGDYPRHRVCGEFIAGLDADTVEILGLAPLLADARRHVSIEWFRAGRPSGSQRLAAPALGISRYRLDQRLADAFREAGGSLRTNTRADEAREKEGRVFTNGRQRRRSDWIGIKMHVRELPLAGDLELHLGRSNYVGLCGVEENAVNVCGLFHRTQATGGGGPELMIRALHRSGLTALADRIQAADPDSASLVTVAGLSFDRDEPEDDHLRLGDALRAIPPFTGHGMTLAFQSAAAAVAPLCEWAHGTADWAVTAAAVKHHIRARAGRRFKTARLVHPWLLSTRRQPLVALAHRLRLLPMPLMTRLLHT